MKKCAECGYRLDRLSFQPKKCPQCNQPLKGLAGSAPTPTQTDESASPMSTLDPSQLNASELEPSHTAGGSPAPVSNPDKNSPFATLVPDNSSMVEDASEPPQPIPMAPPIPATDPKNEPGPSTPTSPPQAPSAGETVSKQNTDTDHEHSFPTNPDSARTMQGAPDFGQAPFPIDNKSADQLRTLDSSQLPGSDSNPGSQDSLRTMRSDANLGSGSSANTDSTPDMTLAAGNLPGAAGPHGMGGNKPSNFEEMTVQGGGYYGTPNHGSDDSTSDIKKIWNSLSDSKQGPMTSIKSDEMSLGRDQGLVIHRRQMTPKDAPQAEESDYTILKFLGEGGMGTVYEGLQTSMQREVAIKTLRPELARKASDRQKFLYEASITGDLDHPNIVPIHDLGVNSDGTLFYSMKRVDGTPWQHNMHTKTRSENIDTLMKVADAVSFAHSRSVIHRDLKPENVMLGQFGEVLVMDWGLAVNLSRDRDFVLGGTPAYMAPEMARHQLPLINACSDIYLLGAMLYQIVTGIPPHPGETVTQCVAAAARNEIIDTGHRDELLSIALRAMATEPSERYESVNDFQQAIRDYEAHAESILLSERAQQELERGKSDGDYERLSRAMFGFQDAVDLWKENSKAVSGLQATRIAYAQIALDKEDFDLGLSMVSPENPAEADLHAALKKGIESRLKGQRRLKTAQRAFMASLVIGLVVATYMYWQQVELKNEAKLAREDAVEKTKEAERNLADAERSKIKANLEQFAAIEASAEAAESQIKAEDQRLEAEAQRHFAEYQRFGALVSSMIAQDESRRAKEQEQAATEQRKLADQEKIKALQQEQEAKRLAQVNALGKIRSDLNVASNDLKAGDVPRAVAYLSNILQDAETPLTFKGWETFRLMQKAHIDLPKAQLSSQPTAVAISDDGQFAAVGDENGIIRVLETQSGDELFELQNPAMAGEPITTMVVANDGRQLLAGSRKEGDNFFVWDLKERRLVQSFNAHENYVTDLEVSKDGLTAITCGMSRNSQELVAYWERSQQDQLFEKKHSAVLGNRVIDVALAPNKQSLFICFANASPFILKVDPTQQSLQVEHRIGDTSSQSRILAGVFDPTITDGSVLYAANSERQIQRWTIPDPGARPRGGLQPDEGFRLNVHTDEITSLSTSLVADEASGTMVPALVSTSADKTVALWNLTTGELIERFVGHSQAVVLGDVANAGTKIISASRNRTVRFWDQESYRDERDFVSSHNNEESDVKASDFTTDGKWLATGDDQGRLMLWDVATGERLTQAAIGHEKNQELRAQLIPNRDLVLAVSADGIATIFDTKNNNQLKRWDDLAQKKILLNKVSPNGRWATLFLADKSDQDEFLVRIVDLEDFSSRVTSLGAVAADVKDLSLSNDGRVLASLYTNRVLAKNTEDDSIIFSERDPTLTGNTKTGIHILPDNKSLVVTTAKDLGLMYILPIGSDVATNFKTARPGSSQPQIIQVLQQDDKAWLLTKSRLLDANNKISNTVELYDVSDWSQLTDNLSDVEPIIRATLPGEIIDASISFTESKIVAAVKGDSDESLHEVSFELATKQTAEPKIVDTDQRLVNTSFAGSDSSDRIKGVGLSKTGDLMVYGDGNIAMVAQDSSNLVFRSIPEPSCHSIQFHPNDSSLLTVHSDGIVRFWTWTTSADNANSLEEFNVVGQLSAAYGYRSASFSTTGDNVLLLRNDGQLEWFSITGNKILDLVAAPNGEQISSVKLAPDGNQILAGTNRGNCLIWKIKAGRLIETPIDLGSLAKQDDTVVSAQAKTNQQAISAVAISNNSRFLAVGDESGNLGIFVRTSKGDYTPVELAGAAVDRAGESERVPIRSLAFNPKETRLLVAQGLDLTFWHLAPQNDLMVQTIFGDKQANSLRFAEFSPDGTLVACSENGGKKLRLFLTSGWDRLPTTSNTELIAIDSELEQVVTSGQTDTEPTATLPFLQRMGDFIPLNQTIVKTQESPSLPFETRHGTISKITIAKPDQTEKNSEIAE